MLTADHSRAKRMDNGTPMQVASSTRLRRWLIVLAVAATATIAYLFVSGHAVAVVSVLPFLLFLACPVIMNDGIGIRLRRICCVRPSAASLVVTCRLKPTRS
jgi:hypothetical protein